VFVAVPVDNLVTVDATLEEVGSGVGVLVEWIRVEIEAPGVRKTLIQTGWVRIDESIGSTNSLGRGVR
jgi:hypothetical protein